ncbi:MAG: hypothetical protein ACFFB0_13160 [Promethearchaeota archaeon]
MDKNINKLNLPNSYLKLFGFELNYAQAKSFLILSLIGIFLLPLFLAIEIFVNLFWVIFIQIPFYMSLPAIYKQWPLSWVIFWYFAPVVIRIIVVFILLYLSIYTLKKIFKPTKVKDERKKKKIQQGRIIKWLGLKLTYGQSLFLFSISLTGILYTVKFLFDSFEIPDFILSGFWEIGGVFNRKVLHIIIFILSVIFVSFFLYNILVIWRKKFLHLSKKTVKNHGLIIFIIFFIIFLFFLGRIFYHIILFTNLAYIFGVSPAVTNPSQAIDLIISVIILTISVIIISVTYFMRENTYRQLKKENDLTWFHIKLTPKRTIILLSLAMLFISFLIYTFLTLILTLGMGIILISFSFVFIPPIFLCYYSINKILKSNCLSNALNSIESSNEIITNWFKLNLKKLDSVIFLSISSGVIIIYVFYLIGINSNLKEDLLNVKFEAVGFYDLLSFLLVTIVLILMVSIAVYTIKKTIPSIKSRV